MNTSSNPKQSLFEHNVSNRRSRLMSLALALQAARRRYSSLRSSRAAWANAPLRQRQHLTSYEHQLTIKKLKYCRKYIPNNQTHFYIPNPKNNFCYNPYKL